MADYYIDQRTKVKVRGAQMEHYATAEAKARRDTSFVYRHANVYHQVPSFDQLAFVAHHIGKGGLSVDGQSLKGADGSVVGAVKQDGDKAVVVYEAKEPREMNLLGYQTKLADDKHRENYKKSVAQGHLAESEITKTLFINHKDKYAVIPIQVTIRAYVLSSETTSSLPKSKSSLAPITLPDGVTVPEVVKNMVQLP
ncbi:MAG: hypothetical protein HUK02_01370 [Bacteroidaceae bacterium]|nr:hypothetical protein [Bacteroidaceae bacterium]